MFHPISDHLKTEIQRRYTNGKPYFVYVGALHPRKNIDRLLLAFDAFKIESGSESQLLIVGAKLWKNTPFEEKLDQLKFKNAVHFSGHVDMETLTQLMGDAKALTFVSYFEGFGIPLVEAMNAGTPILSGDKTSLPEVVGDAAILVDPFSVSSIKNGLLKMDADESLRNSLISKGYQRGKLFSWDKTARIIWDELDRVLNNLSER